MARRNYGFVPSLIIEDKHYILGDGCLSATVLMPSGDWSAYLPANEMQQKNGFESMNCTNYGTNHALVTLGKFKYGAAMQLDLSERYTGVMTGTTQYGNDPHSVIEKIRTYCGEVPEIYLPFNEKVDSWSKYYSPRPMSYYLFSLGQHWLKKYKVGHDWVFTYGDPIAVRQQKMLDALKYSPLGASVFAWSRHDDGNYYDDGFMQNHWIEVYKGVPNVGWFIFDSYDNTHKILDWKFNFGQCKRYTLDRQLGAESIGDTPSSALIPYVKYWLSEMLSIITGK